jgi:hypothetical protein
VFSPVHLHFSESLVLADAGILRVACQTESVGRKGE